MRAIIFAAGKGERMRPLTDHTPKPLLTVNGKPLIDFHLEKLANAGFTQVIINLAYKGQMIKDYCGNGERYGLKIEYSEEGLEPLETGGALNLCLPWFNGECFAMVSADVYSALNYNQLATDLIALSSSNNLAQLILVQNPAHHPKGDFSLCQKQLSRAPGQTFTYSGIGVANPQLIAAFPDRCHRFPLRDAIFYWLEKNKIGGSVFAGSWSDVGTPERLKSLNKISLHG